LVFEQVIFLVLLFEEAYLSLLGVEFAEGWVDVPLDRFLFFPLLLNNLKSLHKRLVEIGDN
jgi:hypothetical protein